MTTSTQSTNVRQVNIRPGIEATAWKWMRYSAFLLIPLAWGHVLLQDVIVGVHAIDVDYVALRWGSLAWRVYDIFLLGFAFAHGMNGLRQVLNDFVHREDKRRLLAWALLAAWALITLTGAVAIIGGARPLPTN
jgi:succinate dehydrogenase / fumarate reductase membrane anchor subunit